MTSTDGCNGMTTRWTADDAGRLLVTGGGSTLVGCDNVQVPEWLMRARWAALDEGELVLLDQRADELGRLRRA